MAPIPIFPVDAFRRFFETLLPDFLLAFTFFTASTYTALAKRFGNGRPAAAVSASLGLALSVGLVWWESRHGYSIRDLGVFALILAVLLISVMVFQAFRDLIGWWAGVGAAVATGVLAVWLLGLGGFLGAHLLAGLLTMALLAGIVSVLVNAHSHTPATRSVSMPPPSVKQTAREETIIRDEIEGARRDRRVSESVWDRLRRLRKDTDLLRHHKGDAKSVLEQIRRLLPPEGWLTERLARLRAQAHRVREGHVARIEELREMGKGLPAGAKKQLSDELSARYQELRLDDRLERLDQAVAVNERGIRNLTHQAEQATTDCDYRQLTELLSAAEKHQGHNTRLLRTIERTEVKLAAIVREISQRVRNSQKRQSAHVRVQVRRRPSGSRDSAEMDEAWGYEKSTRLYATIGEMLSKRFAALRGGATMLPQGRGDPLSLMAQLERTVPEEGWLTEQLAGLREKMHHLRRGHEARMRETSKRSHELTGSARRRAAALARDQKELLHLETRLERLDGAVAEQEKRIRHVTEQATHALGEGDVGLLLRHLRTAEQLQRHANKLLRLIARTENEVVRRMGAIVKRSDEVSPI